MTEFFVPRTGEIKLSDGSKYVLIAGVREVDDAIVNDPEANRYGVKPVHEMTDAERAAFGLPPAPPEVDESIKVESEGKDKDETPPDDGKSRIVTAVATKADTAA